MTTGSNAAPAVVIPRKFRGLFHPHRYKTFYGGRGSGKSWAMARALIVKAHTSKLRILCAREFQTSMEDSVQKLLADQIDAMGLAPWFRVQQKTIVSLVTGSEFLFKGLRLNIQGIKSTEGVDVCWVEEAQTVSAESWQVLLPTIRAQGSEIWVSFNPDQESDPTFKRFVTNMHPGDLVQKVGWQDNKFLPETLDEERRRDLANDPDAYEWIWGGECRKISEAQIFRRRVRFEAFETPADVDRFFYGADWGFANDPTVLIRSFIRDKTLFIDHEAFGYQTEIDHTAALFDKVPDSRDWPIKADGARPETISYMARQGFQVTAAGKWPGSVEDGIEHMKGFDAIVVHERCPRTSQEFRLYSYKTDQKTKDVLPIIVDKWNHAIDAVRYSLDGYIKARGGLGIWERLAD